MATTAKKESVSRIAQRTGTQQVPAKTVVCRSFDDVIAELAEGNHLEFRDLSVFETKISPSRTAQNPRTLEKVHVSATRRIAFTAGRLSKQRLNIPDIVGAPVAP